MEEPIQPNLIDQLDAAMRRGVREHLKAERIARLEVAMVAGDSQPDDLLTVHQAAHQLGVRRSELYRAIQFGTLKPVRSSPPYLLRRADVDGYARERVR